MEKFEKSTMALSLIIAPACVRFNVQQTGVEPWTFEDEEPDDLELEDMAFDIDYGDPALFADGGSYTYM